MTDTQFQILQENQRSNWVRLRTLVTLRWFAILGQITAIVVATWVFRLQIEVGPAALVVGSSVLANLFSSFLYPENRRLSEREATLMLLFDIVQLSLLLYLTGGTNNPFMLLILAPVTISATVLLRRSMLMIVAVALLSITVLSQTSIPIMTAEGAVLELPLLFGFGFWVALMIGVIFLAGYARQITVEMQAMGDALLATQLALSREQKLTDLGGVVAAAAHELGTPLATIKLVSTELAEELEGRNDLTDDVKLIANQADRCREILHSMGRAGKDDLHLRTAPLQAIVQEAAEPHMNRGITVLFDTAPEKDAAPAQPTVMRRPEIIHGLRNLIQNAVDFAHERVEIDISWTDNEITIRIADDGPGIPASVIGRIGDPFVRRRRGNQELQDRPNYEGMGLGLFIAKTLLERSLANLTFANGDQLGSGDDHVGAIVTVGWPRAAIEMSRKNMGSALGENELNLP